MKNVACVIFELQDDERIEDFLKKFERIYDARTMVPKLKVEWKEQLKTILNALGVSPKCSGYKKLFYVVWYAHKKPHAKLNQLYAYASRELKEDVNTIEGQITYIISKIALNNSNSKICEVLKLPSNSEIKVTPAHFIKILAQQLL